MNFRKCFAFALLLVLGVAGSSGQDATPANGWKVVYTLLEGS